MTHITAAPLAKRLKARTDETHERLDKRIMAAEPFGDRARYGRFLKVQQLFHRDVDALYDRTDLAAIVPDLTGRRRLDAVSRDLSDLQVTAPEADAAPRFVAGEAENLPVALGWLYVVEGSNLGAAFLYKAALALGLNETFGARHLAGHPDGRAAHWRTFTGALDAVPMSEEDESRAVAGARAAFERVHALVDVHLA
jgi:heme oxygenase